MCGAKGVGNSERRALWPLFFSLKLEARSFAGTDGCGSVSGSVRMERPETAPEAGADEGEAEKVCRDRKLR